MTFLSVEPEVALSCIMYISIGFGHVSNDIVWKHKKTKGTKKQKEQNHCFRLNTESRKLRRSSWLKFCLSQPKALPGLGQNY